MGYRARRWTQSHTRKAGEIMAQQADGTVYIDTLLDTTGFKAGGKDVEAAVRRMSKTVSGIGETAKIALQKQTDAFVEANQAYAQQERKVEALKNKLKEMSEQKVATDEFNELGKLIDSERTKLNRLEAAQEKFLTTGGNINSSAYKKREHDIEELRNSIKNAQNEQQQLLNTGGAYKAVDTSGAEQKLFDEEQRLQNMNNSLATSYASLKNKVDSYGGSAVNLTSIKKRLNKTFSSLLSMVKKTGSGIKKASMAMLGLNKNTKKSNASLGGSLKSMLKYGLGIRSIFVLVNRLRGALVDGFKNLAQYDGQTNTSISALMSSLTQLKNSFATAFAPILNVVAPILKSFVDMISRAVTYVGMFIASLTGQSSFVKATAVQEDYAASLGDSAEAAKDAEKAQNSYLSGLDEIKRFEEPDPGKSDTGGGYAAPTPQNMFETVPIESSIKGIADKIKSFIHSQDWSGLGTYIADGLNTGIEKIKEIISWDNVGPAVTSFVNAFTTTFNSLVAGIDWNLLGQTVGTGINTIVNTVDLFITGIDWVNLGVSFANGINGIVTSVNWNNLGNMLGNFFMTAWQIFYGLVTTIEWAQVGMAIANGINGFFETFDFATIASGIAAFINGLSTALLNFAITTKWSGIGTEICNAINTFFAETDFALLAKSVSEFIKGILDLAIKAVEGTNWKQVGKKIADFIANIDYGGIISKLFEGFGAVLGGLASFLLGLIEDAWNSVVKWWKDVAFEDGKFTISGLLNGIWEGIKNIGSWIYDHIFKPFVDGFCKAFGINSPSKVMSEQGGYIISGLLGGLKDKFVSVVKWLGGLPAKFKNAASKIWSAIQSGFGNITGWFKDKFSAAWKAVKNVFSSGGKIFNGIKDGILDGLKAIINGLISGINTVVAIPFKGINSALDSLRDVSIVGIEPFGWLPSIPVPQIPYLATGAVIPPNAPFMAVLGDQRRGNNIEAPEDLIRKIVREETAGNNGGFSGTIRVPVNLDGRQIFEVVIDQAMLRRAQSGRSPFELA